MSDFQTYLNKNIRSNEICCSLRKAVAFYGNFMEEFLIDSDCEIQFNDKKNRNHLGAFSSCPAVITFHKVKEQLDDDTLDCVFVHELAHLLDSQRAPKDSRYRWASSSKGSKERAVITLYRSKMVPFPEKRTNYRGRTCELFARSIEEYYAIKTDNVNWIKAHQNWDYYVNISEFKKTIYPVVNDYLNSLK